MSSWNEKRPTGNNPLSGNEQDQKEPSSNPFNDTFHNTPPEPHKKPGLLVRAAGAALAIAGIGAIADASITKDPKQPLQHAQTIGRLTQDTTAGISQAVENQIRGDKKDDPIQITPTSTPEPQGTVSEGAISSEKADLIEFHNIFDKFVDDLERIPASRMQGMQAQGREGYKVAIGDDVYKFTWLTDNPGEKQVEIDTDAGISTFTVQDNLITYEDHIIDAKEFKNVVQNNSISSGIIDYLKQVYGQWEKTRKPIATPTTPNPFQEPGWSDRTNHKANIQPTADGQKAA